jgi:hypothetical protein
MLLGLIGAASWAIWWAASDRTAAAHHPDRVPLARRCCLFVKRERGALDRADRDHDRAGARASICGPVRPDGRAVAVRREQPLGGGIGWALGIDGIALCLICLTAFLMPICIGASWRAIEKRVPEYMGLSC